MKNTIFSHSIFVFFKRVNLNTQFSKTSKLVNQERNLLKIKIAGVLKDGKATNEELKMTVRLRYLLRRTLKIQRLSFLWHNNEVSSSLSSSSRITLKKAKDEKLSSFLSFSRRRVEVKDKTRPTSAFSVLKSCDCLPIFFNSGTPLAHHSFYSSSSSMFENRIRTIEIVVWILVSGFLQKDRNLMGFWKSLTWIGSLWKFWPILRVSYLFMTLRFWSVCFGWNHKAFCFASLL